MNSDEKNTLVELIRSLEAQIKFSNDMNEFLRSQIDELLKDVQVLDYTIDQIMKDRNHYADMLEWATYERDEARREVCIWVSSQNDLVVDCREVADIRKWNCFKE